MLPIGMMRNAHRLPPVEMMVREAKARIAKRDERLSRIEAAVSAVLTDRSAASLTALRDLMEDVKVDYPHEAALPQLDNLGLALQKVGELYGTAEKAVAESNAELSRKLQQHQHLQVILKNLQYTLRSGDGSQIKGFFKECAEHGASYVAHH
jgi:hypothetical protein